MNVDNTDAAKSKTLAWRNSWDIPDMTKQTQAAVKERDAKKRAETVPGDPAGASARVARSSSCSSRRKWPPTRKDVDGFVMGPSFENNLYAAIKK